jgi:hypothetical protein
MPVGAAAAAVVGDVGVAARAGARVPVAVHDQEVVPDRVVAPAPLEEIERPRSVSQVAAG